MQKQTSAGVVAGDVVEDGDVVVAVVIGSEVAGAVWVVSSAGGGGGGGGGASGMSVSSWLGAEVGFAAAAAAAAVSLSRVGLAPLGP